MSDGGVAPGRVPSINSDQDKSTCLSKTLTAIGAIGQVEPGHTFGINISFKFVVV